jgi:mutator protein MutT
VGALIIEEDKLLMIRRGNPPFEGYWSIPGGKIKWGEKLEEALKREVQEELSVEVEVGELAGIVESIVEKEGDVVYHYILIDYFCRIISGTPKASSDALELRWVSLKELRNIKVTPSLLKLLKELKMI